MKKLSCAILFFSIFCLTLCNADTWTFTTGETLEGDFIKYDIRTEKVRIRQNADKRLIEVPETQLIHSDLLRAIRLENNKVSPYWYTDYEKAKTENPNSTCLFLSANGSDKAPFEIFYTKLLLRKQFEELLKSRGIIVCIQDDVPKEIASIRYNTPDDLTWRTMRMDEVMKGRPIALFANLRALRQNKRVLNSWECLNQPVNHADSPDGKFEFVYIPVAKIDSKVRRYNKK